jgi:acyl-[acyl-carrier-protein]-phospholipid O-acyltransferase/long-chain-fatty-acid--[acyl-carrier-protein] ligase
VGVAVLGTFTSLMLRPTPVAEPNLRFTLDAIVIPRQTWRQMVANREMLGVLLISSVFWLVGGVVYPPATNAMGKLQMNLGDRLTAALAATTGAGIATGCVVAGVLCRKEVKGWLVRVGAVGLLISLSLLAIPGGQRGGTLLGLEGSAAALIAVGLFAGLFTVPLQVYLQSQAPAEQKGRIIAAMNLLNWIGICLAAGIYGVANRVLVVENKLPHASVFAVAAALILPVAIFYRAPSRDLRAQEAQG